MTVHEIEPRVPYLSGAITPTWTKAWRRLFSLAERAKRRPPTWDVVVWVTHADSATISVALRSSREDVDDPAWEPPPRIVFRVDDFEDALQEVAGDRSAVRETHSEFHDWSHDAIVRSFESVPVQRLYEEFNPHDRRFSILVATNDRSPLASRLSLLWRNGGGLEPDEFKERLRTGRAGERDRAVRRKATKAKRSTRTKRKR